MAPPRTERSVVDRLVRENLGWLRGWFRGRLKDPEAIDDLCQDSLLKAIESFPSLRDPSRFPRWLYRIATNVLRDHYRSESRRRSRVTFTGNLEGIEPVSDHPDRLGTAEEAERLLEEIRALPRTLREPLLLRHSRGLSYRRIGEILGLRENAVQVRIFRARKILRQRAGREPGRTAQDLPPGAGGRA